MNLITKAIAWTQASAWWIGVCAALASLAWLHGCHTGVTHERDRNALAAARALEQAREADAAATKAVARTLNEVEAKNERARDAASNSDDPLGDAMRELRR